MNVFSIKPGVEVTRVHPMCVEAWPKILSVFELFGLDCTMTSCRDGKHKDGSLHYAEPNCAQDWRTWGKGTPGVQLSQELKEDLAHALRESLGPDFDVVIESTHIHIEYDPR